MTTRAFFGPSARDASSIASNPTRLVNLFAESAGATGRTGHILRSVLGTSVFATLPDVFARDMFEFDGSIFGVFGSTLYQIGGAGTYSAIGVVADGQTAVISRNQGKITVVAGGKYYVWDGTTLSQPTPGAFTAFGSVGYLAGRTVLTEWGGARMCWSDIAAPQTLQALNVATAEQRADNIIRGLVVGSAWMIFGERSTEIWAATGNGGANAFALAGNAVQDIGLKAFNLVTKVDGAAFLIGDDDIAYLAAGVEFRPVSNSAVNTAIAAGTATNCFYFEDRGHKFAGIAFSDRPAWLYDIATGEWTERATRTTYGPFDIRASAKLGAAWLVADNSGRIYSLGRTNADATGPLVREATSLPIYADGRYFNLSEFEPFVSNGYQALSRDASILVSTSPDGNVWSLPRQVTVGAAGDFPKRAVARALGRQRSVTMRMTMTDPVDIALWDTARVRLT